MNDLRRHDRCGACTHFREEHPEECAFEGCTCDGRFFVASELESVPVDLVLEVPKYLEASIRALLAGTFNAYDNLGGDIEHTILETLERAEQMPPQDFEPTLEVRDSH